MQPGSAPAEVKYELSAEAGLRGQPVLFVCTLNAPDRFRLRAAGIHLLMGIVKLRDLRRDGEGKRQPIADRKPFVLQRRGEFS